MLALFMVIGLFFINTVTMTNVSAQTTTPPETTTEQPTENQQTDQNNRNPSEQPVDQSANSDCNIAGLGWWICEPARWIAGGMDMMYSMLHDYLEVRPLEMTTQKSGFYIAWDIMRSIANGVFIIVLLIIVFSQLTSFKVGTYGIKKMASRLIIAAILVNLSYLICAILIDLSNMLGVILKDVFADITKQVLTGTGNFDGVFSFASITQAFLTGGSALLAGGLAVNGSLTAATPFFLPILATLFLSFLVAILVMAARQALIVILVVISPIAFVLYLLPGTEKWFDKWKDLFLIMLIFFPAFAVVFGGSQLAGFLLLANASSIIMFIFGLVVMVAPLAITPLIMKLGGGLLNRFAGIVNDPTKGIVDKSRQWARDKSKIMADNSYKRVERSHQRRKEGRGRWYDLPTVGAVRRASRYVNDGARLRKDQVAEAEKNFENRYHEGERYKRQNLANNLSNDRAELLGQEASNRYDEMKAGHMPSDLKPGAIRALNAKVRGIDPSTLGPDRKMNDLAGNIRLNFEDVSIEGMRKQNTQRVLNKSMADAMLQNTEFQRRAQGIYEHGQQAAIASAIATNRADLAKSVNEGAEIVRHFGLSANERQAHAMGNTSLTKTLADGSSYTFNNDSIFTREFSIEEQMAVGTVSQVSEIIEASGSTLAEFKGTISSALAKSGVKGKAPFLGGKLIDDIVKAEITSKEALQNYVADWVKGGKFNPSNISITDKEGLELLMESIDRPGIRGQIGQERLTALGEMIDEVFAQPDLASNVADNAVSKLHQLRNSLPKK